MPASSWTTGRRAILLLVALLAPLDAVIWLFVPRPADPLVSIPLALVVVALLVTAAEVSNVRIAIGRGNHRLTLAALPFVLGLFVLVPQQHLVAQAVGLLVASALVERRGPLRTAFTLTRSWAATGAGILVFHGVATPDVEILALETWAVTLGAAAIAAIAAAMLVSLATTLFEGRAGMHQPSEAVVAATIGALGAGSLALLVLTMLALAPRTLALLLLPAAMFFTAARANQREHRTNRSLSLLHDISQSMAKGADVDTALARLANTVRDHMDVRLAVVVVAPEGDNALGTGIVARATHGRRPSVEHRPLTEPERRVATASRRPTTGRVATETAAVEAIDSALLDEMELSSDAIVVQLRGTDRPLGFLAVDDRLGDLDGLTDDDRDLLVAVATQLSTSLTAVRLESSLSDLHELQDALRHRADHDALTGLCNRTRFIDEVDDALRRSLTSTAVLFLDLDGFKAVNDSLGHHVGDELLRAVARRLEAATKASDRVARIGGDEFAVLLRDVDEARAREVASRLADVLAEPFELDGGPLSIGTSVGIAQHVGDTPVSAAALLRNADAAMYAAKREGGTRTRAFEEAMHERSQERGVLRDDIQRAMTFDEFIVHVQPLVDLGSGRVVGAEALVRWGHPHRGLLPPGTFLDLADETGLLRELGHRVLRESCLLASEWPHDTLISVNISRSQLIADELLVREVAASLADAGIDPSRLVLEVTESSLTSNVERATVRLRELNDLGVRIALDDFGTGLSSLQHLSRMPVDVVKIGRPFVAAIGGAETGAARIAKGIIRMADALGLDTIAEGIELPGQAEQLRDWGCRLGQGYLLGRPMFATDLPAAAGWTPYGAPSPVDAGVAWVEG